MKQEKVDRNNETQYRMGKMTMDTMNHGGAHTAHDSNARQVAGQRATTMTTHHTMQKPQLNQKECVKIELKKYLQGLQDRGMVGEPINSNTLRDAIVPNVKKQMALSYTIGPKLMYDWAKEVNDQHFQSRFQFHYASNTYRARGGRATSQSTTITPNVQHKMEKENQELKSNMKTLMNNLSGLTNIAQEKQILLSIIQQQANEREKLVQTINLLTSECTALRDQLQINNPQPTQKRKRKRSNVAAQLVESSGKLLEEANQVVKINNALNIAPGTLTMNTTINAPMNGTINPPSIMNITPNFASINEPATVHLTLANVPANQNYELVVMQGNMMVKSYPLPETASTAGFATIALGTFTQLGSVQLVLRHPGTGMQSMPVEFSIQANFWEEGQLALDPYGENALFGSHNMMDF